MKTQIVRLLDSGCALIGHRFGCRLAYWSERLDERWDTGEWGPFRSVKIERVRTELADCQRTIRALDDLVQDLRMYAEQDACEIERLEEQVDCAHAILGSESMIWLTVGSNHPEVQWAAISPAVQEYWTKYGNAFRLKNGGSHDG